MLKSGASRGRLKPPATELDGRIFGRFGRLEPWREEERGLGICANSQMQSSFTSRERDPWPVRHIDRDVSSRL